MLQLASHAIYVYSLSLPVCPQWQILVVLSTNEHLYCCFIYSCVFLSTGNRSAHYRGFKAGVTLVHFLTSVPRALARFRERVEKELPNMYDWFADNTLHITVRAIMWLLIWWELTMSYGYEDEWTEWIFSRQWFPPCLLRHPILLKMKPQARQRPSQRGSTGVRSTKSSSIA